MVARVEAFASCPVTETTNTSVEFWCSGFNSYRILVFECFSAVCLSHRPISFSLYVSPTPPEELRGVKFGDAGNYEKGLSGSFSFMAAEK
jgi:hypothetical protein